MVFEKLFTTLMSEIIKKERVTVFTGAGVSTDSGIPDFQSTDASWSFDVSRETAISEKFLYSNPVKFWEIYNTVFPPLEKDIKPSAAHEWVKELENHAEVQVVTQNVDGLHQKAGSVNVFEVHGNTQKYRCNECGNSTDAFVSNEIPSCSKCFGLLRPDLVMFNDLVPGWKRLINDAKAYTGVVLFMGTSLNVYPIAGLPATYFEYSPLCSSWWWTKNPEQTQQQFFDHTIDHVLSFPKLDKND